MFKSLHHSVRRPVSLLMLVCMVVLVFALAACGDNASASSSTPAASSSGSSAAAPAGMTVNVKETKGASGTDVYTCDPATVTIKAGDSVSFTNMSDENQDFDQGDTKKAGVDFKIGLNQTIPAKFKTAGTFTIKSEKGASITVTVQ